MTMFSRYNFSQAFAPLCNIDKDLVEVVPSLQLVNQYLQQVIELPLYLYELGSCICILAFIEQKCLISKTMKYFSNVLFTQNKHSNLHKKQIIIPLLTPKVF